MSFEINKQNLDYTQISNSKIRYISECDIIVPDTKADIGYILEVTAKGQIDNKHIAEDEIVLSGNVYYNILYVSDENSPRVECINYTAPFSHSINADCKSDVIVSASCEPVHTEYSVHNSRKLNARCALDFKTDIFRQNQITVATCVSDSDMAPNRIKSLSGFNMISSDEQTFHIDETFNLPEHSPKITSIAKSSFKIAESELKTVSNKIVVKGTIGFNALYIADEELCTFEGEIPFTHIADMPKTDNGCECDVKFQIKNTNVSVNAGIDATMSQILAEADVFAEITYFDETTLNYISDIYSPDYEMEVTSKTVTLSQIADKMNTQCIVSNTVYPKDDIIVEKIYSMQTDAYIEDVVVDDSFISVSGMLATDIVFESDQKEIHSISEKLPFECNLSTDRKYSKTNTRLDASVVAEHSSYSIDNNGVNVRGVLRIKGTLISDVNTEVVESVNLDENKKTDKSNQAGITVYFVQKGDTLWDISKRYNTLESEISKVNNLADDEVLSIGRQLLIPKR